MCKKSAKIWKSPYYLGLNAQYVKRLTNPFEKKKHMLLSVSVGAACGDVPKVQ